MLRTCPWYTSIFGSLLRLSKGCAAADNGPAVMAIGLQLTNRLGSKEWLRIRLAHKHISQEGPDYVCSVASLLDGGCLGSVTVHLRKVRSIGFSGLALVSLHVD